MSKEEILKIQTCVLKVNMHCDGCENKVKKILQKIDGVYKISTNSEQGKVTVSGNVEPATLIKKLGKSGKHAELWGTPKPNLSQLNINNNNRNFQIDSAKGANSKKQKGNNDNNNSNKNNNNQPKGGQIKGLPDLKLPQFKGLKLPFGKDQNKKVTFEEIEGDMSDDEYDDDDYDDDDEFGDDDFTDDEMDGVPRQAKGKPVMGNGQMPNMMGMMMNGQSNGGNGKKGGGGNLPVKANDGKNGSNGKKGGGGGNVAQNQGGGGKGGKNSGGNPFDGKNGGGAMMKNTVNISNGNGGKKPGGGMNDGLQGMPNMSNGLHHGMGGGKMGPMGNNMPMGPMGNFPMGQMPAVQGLPAMGGPEAMAGNPYYQQQLAAAMMNQQRVQGNERFQPMMYARPPPAVNYMPPYYPYPPPADPFTHAFSDENTSSCSLM